MSQEYIRQALATAVEAAKVAAPTAGLIIEYDNRIIVDTQTQVDPYLLAQIVLFDGVQADLAANAIHRFYGQLHLIAAVKEGAGSADALKLLDHFVPQLQRKSFAGVRLETAKPAPSKKNLGWVYFPTLIPFWYDKIY
jgi:hypothetical protein